MIREKWKSKRRKKTEDTLMERQKLIQLLQKMTLEEKCRELMQIPVEAYVESDISTGPCEELHLTPEKMAQVGSVLSLAGAKETKRVQEKHLEKNRLGIPLLFMADVINGYRTIFPIPLAQGCTFHKLNPFVCHRRKPTTFRWWEEPCESLVINPDSQYTFV